jgi:uncharacterized protein (DUF983 family)
MGNNIWKAGLLSRCPACGQGPLFDGFLTIKPKCTHCGTDFAGADSGDGPAVFVILAAGAICVPFVLIAQLALKPPIWLLALVALPLTAAVCIGLLRPFKAMLFALQWYHKAGEGVTLPKTGEIKDDGKGPI